MTLLGSNVNKAAGTCTSIITLYPFKKSGFYWIKSLCMPVAQRLFCDFEDKFNIKSYFFLGKTEPDKILGQFKKNPEWHIRS